MMLREMTLLRALAGTAVPHPSFIAGCEDTDVLGAVFYLMHAVDGYNAAESLSPAHAADPDTRRRMGLAMVDALTELGRIDPAAIGLTGFGRPEGFLERQVGRWTSELESYTLLPGYPTVLLPGVDRAWVKSLWAPGVRWTEVTEEGFRGGPVMPDNYDGSPAATDRLRGNIARANLVGSLVGTDFKSSMLVVPLLDQDPTTGLRIGSAPVGHTGYIHSRLTAYFLDLKEPKIIPGYENEDLEVAFARGEVDAQVASTGTVVEHDYVNKKLADFHSAVEIPKGQKDARFAHLNLPDLEAFAKTDPEKKLLRMVRDFRSVGTILLFPPGTPNDRVEILKEAVRKTHTDPGFIKEYRKLTGGDSPTPLMPDEQAKLVKGIPRDAETIELFKKFAGTAPLPAR